MQAISGQAPTKMKCLMETRDKKVSFNFYL